MGPAEGWRYHCGGRTEGDDGVRATWHHGGPTEGALGVGRHATRHDHLALGSRRDAATQVVFAPETTTAARHRRHHEPRRPVGRVARHCICAYSALIGYRWTWNPYFLVMMVIVGIMAATKKDAAVLETAIVVLGGVWAMLLFK